ncbi:MAG: ABC transporter ATP-binding protein [Planctomycetia bacterium]|nr:ABC transporter ATP-binding protein [Planctomycetia bacterium]
MASVVLEQASLTFQVTPHGPVRWRDLVADRLRRSGEARIQKVQALREIDFRLSDGDRVGIVGHNGAGKSTLLKILADIYPLTQGTRRVEGRVSALFDIALGFELDATGWENIRYRGYLQGQTRRGVRRKQAEVAEFSELGRALELPVRYYSDGMRVRLAFSIATAIEPDILLVDEAFNAGDIAFRSKARRRLNDVMRRASIVVAVSHELDVLRQLCDLLLWLDQGQVRAFGRADDVLRQYQEFFETRRPAAVAA